jgi:hypothetical protein
MSRCLTLLAPLLVAPVLLADVFDINVNIAQTFNSTIIPLGQNLGSFTTNGSCLICKPANGGITEFQISIMTGSNVSGRGDVLFDALDSTNLNGAMPQYDSVTQILSGPQPDGSIVLEETISTGGNSNSIILLQLTSTAANTQPACTDLVNLTGTGCVSIRPVEEIYAAGTYSFTSQVPEPPATTLLLTVLVGLKLAFSGRSRVVK